jgi:hypothetical protein
VQSVATDVRGLAATHQESVRCRVSGKALAAGIAANQDDQEPAASAVPLTYFSNDAKGKMYGKMPESSVSLALAHCRFRLVPKALGSRRSDRSSANSKSNHARFCFGAVTATRAEHEGRNSSLASPRIACVRRGPAFPGRPRGVLPRWLAEQGAQAVIAGGMEPRAQQMLAEKGIQVILGAAAPNPEELTRAYLNGELAGGANACDHSRHTCGH